MQRSQYFINSSALKKKNRKREEKKEQNIEQTNAHLNESKEEQIALCHFVILKDILSSITHFWRVTEFEDPNIF